MPRMNGTSPSASTAGPTMTVDFGVQADDAEKLFLKLENLLSPEMLAVFMAGPVVQHFQQRFNEFFEDQGTPSGAWQPLSEVTIADRVEQGFGPGPINERTGQLRDFITDSPGEVRVLATLAVLTYPGPLPSGELGRKVKTAQQGGTFSGHSVPARPVMEIDETDMLFTMSALNFYIERGME